MMKSMLVSFAVIFSGCVSLSPEYERPQIPVASTFDTQKPMQTQSVSDLKWEAFVQDTRLREVMTSALAQNRDLRKSISDIEAARATYRITKSNEFPTIEASATGTKARTNSTTVSQSSSATVGLSSYELDFFGKVKNTSTMELETYLGVKEAARAVKITLIAETATAWLTLASDQSLLNLSQKTFESAKRSLEIVQRRVDLGIDSKVSLYDAQTLVEEARANIASYTTQVGQDRAALELLVGMPLEERLFPAGLEENAPSWLSDVPVGLSSSILLERPDVLEAEHNLKAANANIGIARAAYFPSITLTAKGGVGSSTLTGLFTGSTSNVWSFAPSIDLPIFDAGSRDATLDYAKAKKEGLIATYEMTIQTAFKEVASALARRKTIVEQLNAQEALVDASAKSYGLYDARYQKGVDTYLNALVAQRTLYTAEKSLLSVRLEELSNRVTLYQVLGGGLAE